MSNKRVFKKTRRCDAHYYLDENGYQIGRKRFLEENKDWYGWMIYVGPGYVHLRLAVLTCNARRWASTDMSAPASTAREWLEHNRPDELYEDDGAERPDWVYCIEPIPAEVEDVDTR